MLKPTGRSLLLGTLLLAAIGCQPLLEANPAAADEPTVIATSTPTAAADVAEESMDTSAEIVQKAQEDLAARLDIPVDQVELREVRAVTWPDASLGCPEPGKVYAQMLQDGLLIRLSAGGELYFYHSGGGQDPFFCEQTNQIIPDVTPTDDEFVPPPDSEID